MLQHPLSTIDMETKADDVIIEMREWFRSYRHW